MLRRATSLAEKIHYYVFNFILMVSLVISPLYYAGVLSVSPAAARSTALLRRVNQRLLTEQQQMLSKPELSNLTTHLLFNGQIQKMRWALATALMLTFLMMPMVMIQPIIMAVLWFHLVEQFTALLYL